MSSGATACGVRRMPGARKTQTRGAEPTLDGMRGGARTKMSAIKRLDRALEKKKKGITQMAVK